MKISGNLINKLVIKWLFLRITRKNLKNYLILRNLRDY